MATAGAGPSSAIASPTIVRPAERRIRPARACTRSPRTPRIANVATSHRGCQSAARELTAAPTQVNSSMPSAPAHRPRTDPCRMSPLSADARRIQLFPAEVQFQHNSGGTSSRLRSTATSVCAGGRARASVVNDQMLQCMRSVLSRRAAPVGVRAGDGCPLSRDVAVDAIRPLIGRAAPDHERADTCRRRERSMRTDVQRGAGERRTPVRAAAVSRTPAPTSAVAVRDDEGPWPSVRSTRG
jgi:hypothetical protein